MKLFICLFRKWYLYSNQKLNLIETYKLFSKISKVSFIERKEFERKCKTIIKVQHDIKYFKNCQEMKLFPEI